MISLGVIALIAFLKRARAQSPQPVDRCRDLPRSPLRSFIFRRHHRFALRRHTRRTAGAEPCRTRASTRFLAVLTRRCVFRPARRNRIASVGRRCRRHDRGEGTGRISNSWAKASPISARRCSAVSASPARSPGQPPMCAPAPQALFPAWRMRCFSHLHGALCAARRLYPACGAGWRAGLVAWNMIEKPAITACCALRRGCAGAGGDLPDRGFPGSHRRHSRRFLIGSVLFIDRMSKEARISPAEQSRRTLDDSEDQLPSRQSRYRRLSSRRRVLLRGRRIHGRGAGPDFGSRQSVHPRRDQRRLNRFHSGERHRRHGEEGAASRRDGDHRRRSPDMEGILRAHHAGPPLTVFSPSAETAFEQAEALIPRLEPITSAIRAPFGANRDAAHALLAQLTRVAPPSSSSTERSCMACEKTVTVLRPSSLLT